MVNNSFICGDSWIVLSVILYAFWIYFVSMKCYGLGLLSFNILKNNPDSELNCQTTRLLPSAEYVTKTII